jgi:hypothetical protein
MITLADFMIVSAVLFCIGMFIIVSKKELNTNINRCRTDAERRYFKPGSFWQV